MNRKLSLRASAVIYAEFIMLTSALFTFGVLFMLINFSIVPNSSHKPIQTILTTVVSSCFISLPISILIVQYYIQPIAKIKDATCELAKGNFKVRVVSTGSNGEMAELEQSFNAMAQELDNMEIFRSDFINTFSHEFKTPIVSIRGFAHQLKNPNLTEEQRLEYIDIIINESNRLAGMSSNVLLLTKFENLEIVTDKEVFSLDEQLRTSILLLEKKWTEKDINLDLELDTISINTNQEMLSHVWTNLLDNAIKFSPQGSTLYVSCIVKEHKAVVTITDEGIGMTPEQQAHIFDKFYQADVSHVTQGNGLGLSIVKRIITLVDGTVTVRSDTDEAEHGTSFIVTLPLE